MKTQFKRFSKSTISVLLAVCLLFSCMTVGIIATDAAKDDSENVGAISSHFYLIGNLTGDNWNSNQTNYKIDTSYGSDGKFYIEVDGVQNAWFALWNGSSRYAPSSSCEASSSNPNAASGDYDHSGNSWQYKGTASKIKICIDETVGTRSDKEWYPAVWVEEVASTTPLSKPTLKYNNATTTPVDISGSSANLTWANVTNASSYTVYKDGTAVKTNATSPYSATSTGSYTVKAIGDGTTYSDSDASNAIQLNFQKTTTIYVHKNLKNKNNGGPMTNAHIWSNSNDNWTGTWPGQTLSSDWTESGDYYYKSFTNAYSTFKIILNGNSAQTDNSAEYETGKTYRIDSVNTSGSNGQAVLTEGAPVSYGITYSGSNITWGSGKPTSAYAGDTVSFTVSANSGYRLSEVKYNDGEDHVLTASSGTYSFTMPAKAVEVTATTVGQVSVTLTTNTGVATTQYKLGSSGTYTNYSSALTVDSGTDVYFKVTYSTGYEYASNSGLTVVTANTEFKTGSVTAAKSVNINAQKITYTGLDVTAKYSTTGASSSYDNPMSDFYTPTKSADSGTRIDGITVTAQDEVVTSGGVKYKFHHWSCVNGDGVFSGTGNNNGANGVTSLTFYPYKSDVIPVALYKKVYTITIGDNEAGEGSGTVTRSAATVVAGGSYTITLTPDSYSIVSTLKINGSTVSLTAGSGNVKTYTGTATANVTAVGKFTTDVKLGNKYLDAGNTDTWNEPVMTSKGDGTYEYNFSNVPSGRNGQFKAKVGNTYKGYTSDTVFDDGGTTCTLSSINDGGVNYKLTTTEAVNVKVIYTASSDKITSVIIDPVSSVTYAITVGSPADATLTATYRGATYNEGDTINARAGQEITFSATTADSKYVTGYTLGGTAVTSPHTVAASDNGKTLSCTVADKLKITSTTNKTAWGTVSTSPKYARPGDTVTITCTPAAGTLSTLVAYDTTNEVVVKSWKRNSSGQMVVDQAQQNSANQFTQVGLSGIAGSIYSFIKDAGEALGAADDSKAVGDDPFTFNMPNGSVSITATYEDYVGTSEYIYHGRNTSGQAVSGYENEVMSEGVINGQKYAYYNVTGRESVGYDQLFYISKGGSTEGRYVYFTAKGESYDDWNLPYGTNAHAYFFNSNGQVGTAFPGSTMEWIRNEGDNNKDSVWKIAIPSGATGVIFSNGKSGNSQKQTEDLSLTNVGAYYPSGYSNNKYTCSTWGSAPSDAGIIAGTDYYWDTDVYKDQWYTGGFSNHNVNNDHNYAKPKDGNGQTFSDSKSDYYIVVLYPNTSYTFNLPGHDAETKTVGAKPMVLWMPQLPGQTPADNPTVKVYAKDGAIRRDGDSPERNDRTYSSFEQYANTFVYSDSGYATHIGTRSSHDGQSSEGSTGYNGYTYDYVNKFNKGDTLYIKTVLKDDTFMNKYYLAAYSINGKTYALHTTAESDTRTVTEAFTVPEDWEDKYVEITPIYFLRDSAGTNTITFYIEGYDETVMNAGWGNTPFVYPFYQDANFNYVSNINNAFGGYPGQPMVFYKGNYYIQLPKEITTTISTGQTGTATIKGVTLGNGYWDDIHLITGEVSSHYQTYDYDDLYKIYSEYPNQADHIICSFKYRTKKNNDEPASMSSSIAANYNTTNGNGWEVLTNYYGEPVDVFGNVLTDSAKTLAEDIMAGRASAETSAVVHAISQDYKSNSAGDYATEWVIYNTSGTKVVATSGGKTSIVPSALAINANTGSGELTANFDKYDNATKAFKSIYTALYNDTNVRNQPAVVTYEKSIYGGGDKADRCDARWYYSKKGKTITATTRIEYTDDGKTWNTDTYNTNTGTGSYTGAQAYFTGTATTATDTPTSAVSGKNTTTLDGTVGGGYYTFSAEGISGGTNGNYEFVGWYLLRDNYQNISSRSDYGAVSEFPSHAEMSKNGDIFVARFKKTATGTFDIYHEIHPQTSGYGTVTVSAIVKDSNGDPISGASYPASGTTNHVTIPSDYIRSGSGNTVVATFTATPYGTSNFEAFYETVQNLLAQHEEYGFITNVTINGTTATVTYDVNSMFSAASGSPVQTVSNVTHYSKFSLKTNLTYSLQYTFKTRYYGTKLYKYTNVKFTEQELRSYFLDQITDPNCNHIKLDKQFVKAKAPFESNFREDLTWVVDNVTFNDDNDPTIGYLTATQVKTKWANVMVYDFDNSGDMQTTTMVAPFEKLFNASINTKPSYPTTEDEAQAIKDWSVDRGQMYYPTRSSYTHGGTTTPLYIDHWDIYQLDSFTYNTENNLPKMKDDGFNLDVDISKSVLVAQAYSKRFNYVAYEDYAIVPVYTTENVDIQEESDKRKDSSATLLTLTRNQWNANAANNDDASSYRDGADRVYVDIMLNYNYSVKINGKDTNILLNSTGDNIKVGFIVRSYTWVNEQKSYGKTQYVLVDKDQINDKNRIEYCFGFNNNENNRRAGLYFEFKPFIVDTANQAGSAGCDVTIDNTPYKALYADSTVSVLDQVSFYQLGRL